MALSKVEICGVDTAKLPVLTNERMRNLLPKAHSGDTEARREMIEGNLKLVLSVMQRFAGRGENPDDLFQVGCVGLMKSIDNFDINQNVRFSTYAVPMIIGEIRRHLRDNNPIRVSRSMRDTAYKALKAREHLSNAKGIEPRVEDIAKEMDIAVEDVVFALEAIQEPVSLFEPVFQDGADSLCIMDQVRDDRDTDEGWTRDIAINDAISRLTERERMIIRERFYLGRTQMEVAEAIGISQAQVSRLEKTALKQMRRYVN